MNSNMGGGQRPYKVLCDRTILKHTKSLCHLRSQNTDAQKLGTPRGQSGPKVGSKCVCKWFLGPPSRAIGRGAHAAREGRRGARSGSARALSCASPPQRIRSTRSRSCRRWWWRGRWKWSSPLRGRCRGPGRIRSRSRRWRRRRSPRRPGWRRSRPGTRGARRETGPLYLALTKSPLPPGPRHWPARSEQ
jgi:hypothetical protein